MNATKVLLLLILSLACLNLLAAEKLVLLTSLDPAKNRPALRSSAWDINQKLENIFYQKLTPYHTSKENIKIIHFATIEDLTRELADGNNKAVFWVSHANGSATENGLDQNIVVDFEGKDVTEGFQNPSSKLAFLGFVGCHAKYLVEKNKANGFMLNNENLQIFSSSKKVDARIALKRAIGNYLFHAQNQTLSESTKACNDVERHELVIKRTIPTNIAEGKVVTAIKVLQKERLIGVFPKGSAGEEQTITVSLFPGESKRDVKLVLDSGIASEEVEMGEFLVAQTRYQIFSGLDGKPLGKGRYVLNYKGELTDLPVPTLVNETNCIE